MHQKYDICSKWLIECYGDAILGIAGFDGVESFTPLAAELVHSRQLPDGLLEVRFAGQPEPVLFLIEVSTVPEARVDEQLLRDLMMVYINRGTLPEMLTLVLRPKGRAEVSESLTRASPLGHTTFAVRWSVIDLWQRSPVDTSAGMAPWMALMKTSEPPEVHLRRCMDLAATAANPDHREKLLVITQVMAGLRYHEAQIERVFQREFSMIESPLLDKWAEQRVLRERQQMILEFLSHRGMTVDESIATAVKSIRDASRLSVLSKAAATCESVDTFRTVLNATL
jgi:hypothetical protein